MNQKVEDITLDNLESTRWFSVRAINICRHNNLNGLGDIITFYRRNGSFKNLERCGYKTQKELTKICEHYSNHALDTIIENIQEVETLKRLINESNAVDLKTINQHIEYLTSRLSVRAFNGLRSLFNGMPQTREQITKMCSSSFNFNSIRNIGEKSVTELNSLREALLDFIKKFKFQENELLTKKSISQLIIMDLNETFADIANEFSPFKKAALNQHTEYLISNLGVRAKNGITEFFGNAFSPKEVIEKIYSYSFDFDDIKNIGSKTVLELNTFKQDISSFIKTLQFIENDQLSREYAKLIVKTSFTNLPINFNEQFDNIFDTSGKINLFKLILLLIENGQLFKRNEKELFYLLYTETKAQSFDQIAKALDLTKERLRQIKVILEDEIQDYFRFILSFNSQDLIDYNITSEKYFKVIDNFFIQKINASEDVKFNVRFYSIIFGLLLGKSHSVLGDNETISGKGNYSNVIHYKNCYIIDNVIFHSFDFEKFTTDVSAKLTERITETYALHFEGYLLQFIKQDGKQYFLSIRETCEAVLYNEFDLVVNSEGYVVFERKVKKLMLDYALEILEELGEMTKIETITKAIIEKYPGLAINEQSIRSTLHREKELFIYIGRTSTYGLAKWESEREDLKGGTIRNLTEEFLQKHAEPKHITDILVYVLKFRPNTYERSVLDNLKADKSGKFIFFGKGLVGLKSVAYASIFFGMKRVIKDWGENYQLLKEFRQKYPNRWPSVLSQKKSERSLYAFLYKNRAAYYNQTLIAGRLALLIEIGFLLYLDSSKESNWFSEFDKLKSFVQKKIRGCQVQILLIKMKEVYIDFYT